MMLPNSKLEKVCADKSDVRYYLRTPYVDVEKSRLLATDGHAMAVVPVDTTGIQASTSIPLDCIKAARKNGHVITSVKGNPDGVEDVGSAVTGGNVTEQSEPCRYPDVDRVIPTDLSDFSVTFDAEILYRLAQAICEPQKGFKSMIVTLTLSQCERTGRPDPGSALRIEPMWPVTPDSFGVLMPCRK